MTKKVAFGPNPASKQATADAWVAADAPKPVAEPTRRLTIDIPVGLHTRLKVGCALQGHSIADVVRELLERAFPSQ